MSDDVLERTKLYLQQTADKYADKKIDVQLHGGEPMLFDLDKLDKFIDDVARDNIRWGITTNLVYKITSKHLKIFSKMLPYDDVPYVMTSWDYGIRFNKQQEAKWKANVNKLHLKGMVVQPIICITNKLVKEKTAAEIFDMLEELDIKNVNFERITATGNAKDTNLKPLNREVDNWLFDAYLLSKEKNVHVPLFESVEDSTNGFLNGCRARHCMQNVTTINPDGSVAACPNIANLSFGQLETNGNVKVNQIKKMCVDIKESTMPNKCYACVFFKYCNGECCQLQYDDSGCPGLMKIYDYLINRKNELI